MSDTTTLHSAVMAAPTMAGVFGIARTTWT